MLTHEEFKAKILENLAVRAEYDRLNREEFALPNEFLAARGEALEPEGDEISPLPTIPVRAPLGAETAIWA